MPLPTAVPALRGPRVAMRGAEDRDVPALFAIFSDPEVVRYWSTAPWTDHEPARAMIARDRGALEAGEALRWMIVDEADVVAGCVALHKHDGQSRRAELGYVLGRRAWGRGWAREAVSLAIDQAFGAFGLHRLEADTDPRNDRSVRLLESLGFAREGLLRERWIVAGEVSDTAFYGLLAREWRAP